MTVITKKILPEWFDAIASGKKKYELRLADFEIQEGDTLRLEEWIGEGENRKPTGRVIEKKIGYIQKVNMSEWLKKQPEINEKGMYVLQFDENPTKTKSNKPTGLEKDYYFLVLSVCLGIFGGMLGAIMDRHFLIYGFAYEFIVSIIFFTIIYFLNKIFVQRHNG